MGTCPHWRLCWRTRARPAPITGSSAATTGLVALAAGDDRAAADAPEHDVDSWERRAVGERAALGPAGRGRDAGELRLRLRQRRGLALFAAGAAPSTTASSTCTARRSATTTASPPSRGPKDIELLAGIHNRTIVFGHSHQQFQREGPSGTYLVNPGSVGMPLDGDVSAAYALWHGGRSFELRRAEYDFEKCRRGLRGARVAVREDGGEAHPPGLGLTSSSPAPLGLEVGRALQLVRQVVHLEAARVVVRVDVALALARALRARIPGALQRPGGFRLPRSRTSRASRRRALCRLAFDLGARAR